MSDTKPAVTVARVRCNCGQFVPAADFPASACGRCRSGRSSRPPRWVEALEAAADGVPLAVAGARLGGVPRAQVASLLSTAYRRLDVSWVARGERRAAAVRAARAAGLIGPSVPLPPVAAPVAPEPRRDPQRPPTAPPARAMAHARPNAAKETD